MAEQVIICGGVISQTEMFSGDIWGKMMLFYMEDDKFEVYKKLRESEGKSDKKSAIEWFKKYAKSII